jgi:excisionase family DNA binding protein
MPNTEFQVVKEMVQPDSRGRISLGTEVKSKTYRVLANDLGQILLEPVVAVPEREAWLFQNPGALSAVEKGLQESADGLGTSLGSFAEDQELTIQQAADILNVSRPYLVELLESGEIPFEVIGGRKKLHYQDVIDYKNKTYQLRVEALAELAAQAQELNMGY